MSTETIAKQAKMVSSGVALVPLKDSPVEFCELGTVEVVAVNVNFSCSNGALADKFLHIRGCLKGESGGTELCQVNVPLVALVYHSSGGRMFGLLYAFRTPVDIWWDLKDEGYYCLVGGYPEPR